MRALLIVCLLGRMASAEPAEESYQEGLRLYDLREWEAAIAKFKEAYRLRPDPLSLFNLAQASRLKGACGEALSFYRTYRRNYPEQANIAKVEKFIAEMEACAAKPEPKPTVIITAPRPAPPPPPQHPEHHADLMGIALVGGGVVAVVGGVLFARAASQRADDATHLMGVWDPALQSAGQRDAHLGVALTAIGAAAIIGGLGYHLFVRTETVTVVPQPGGAAVAWSRQF